MKGLCFTECLLPILTRSPGFGFSGLVDLAGEVSRTEEEAGMGVADPAVATAALTLAISSTEAAEICLTPAATTSVGTAGWLLLLLATGLPRRHRPHIGCPQEGQYD